MNIGELHDYVVKYVANNKHSIIQRLLDRADGDCDEALKLMTVRGEGVAEWQETDSWRLGNWGSYGPDARVQCQGSAAGHPIEAWLPQTNSPKKKPDLIVTWREVFEYVKSGKTNPVQLVMF